MQVSIYNENIDEHDWMPHLCFFHVVGPLFYKRNKLTRCMHVTSSKNF